MVSVWWEGRDWMNSKVIVGDYHMKDRRQMLCRAITDWGQTLNTIDPSLLTLQQNTAIYLLTIGLNPHYTQT